MNNFKYNIFHYEWLCNKYNKFPLNVDNNWVSKFKGRKSEPTFEKPGPGFEECLKVIIYEWNKFEKINGKATYYVNVFKYMKNYLPGR